MGILVPADVEHVMQEYLKERLSSGTAAALVSTRFGDAEQVVHLFSTGGFDRTLVSGEHRIVFDCYGQREGQAQQLAALVHGLVVDAHSRLIGRTQIYDVEATLPANFPHPERPDYYRYQFNATIHARHRTGTI